MGISASIEVSYKLVDGWHIFEAEQLPGFYVANTDPRKAYDAIGPTLEQLVKLDTGMDCHVAPDVPLTSFIGNLRADLTSACKNQQRQRFNLFKDAA
jgi:hypothetical protein